jgi:hypothetical protein
MAQIKEYKVLTGKEWMRGPLSVIGLFIPVPFGGDAKYTPDYVIGDYGFIYTIKIGEHVALGHVIILVSVLVNLIMK